MSGKARSAQELQQILEEAFARYQQGEIGRTATLCRKILKALPGEPNALHLLGISHLMSGRGPEAAEVLARALMADADNAEIHNSLGSALRASGRIDDAEASFRRAVELGGRSPQGHFNLGNALRAQTRLEEAEHSYRRALKLDPDHAGAMNNLGLVLEERGKAEAALDMFDRSVAAHPGQPEADRNAAAVLRRLERWAESLVRYDAALATAPEDAESHTGRGFVLDRLGRHGDAETAFRKALEHDPDSPDAHINLANALCERGRNTDAIAHFDKAVQLAPDSPEIHSNLGNALAALGRLDQALDHYDQALALAPDHADAWSNKGNALKRLDRIEDAHAAYDHAVAVQPDHRDARFGRATSRLLAGDFAGGWDDFRWRPGSCEASPVADREILPADLSGSHIAVGGGHGLGDEIFFLRFIPALSRRGPRLSYVSDPRLTEMIGRAGLVARTIADDAPPPPADRTLSVAELPYLLGQDGGGTPPSVTIPAREDKVVELAGRLAAFGPPPHIGVTWRAGAGLPPGGIGRTAFKQCPIDGMGAALGGIGGTVIALQRDPGDGELDAFAAALGRPVHAMTGLNRDLEAMLALMGLLDDYICVSNTNVHLRAARGRSCRVLVANPPEFRWMARGTVSPWFPGTRVYRQRPDGRWSGAFEALVRDLESAQEGTQGSTRQ